jgi:hypothetical protein
MKLLIVMVLVTLAIMPAAIAQRPSLTERKQDEIMLNPELKGPVPPGRIAPETDLDGSPPAQDHLEQGEDDLAFETDILDWQNTPAREQAEERMQEHVESWLRRIQRFEASERGGGGGGKVRTMANELEEKWKALEQSYQKIVQSRREDHWRKSSADFRLTSEDLAQTWAMARQSQGPGQ